MRINYLNNVTEELLNDIFAAGDWEKCDMLLELNKEAQKKQENIIKSEHSTKEEVELAKLKLAKLQSEECDLKKKMILFLRICNICKRHFRQSTFSSKPGREGNHYEKENHHSNTNHSIYNKCIFYRQITSENGNHHYRAIHRKLH